MKMASFVLSIYLLYKIIRKKIRKVLVFRKNFIPLHPQSETNISDFVGKFR